MSPTNDLTITALRRTEQARAATPEIPPGLVARTILGTTDLVYGRDGSFPKFRALELVARVMYQGWESVAYRAITLSYPDAKDGRALAERVDASRRFQDTEQRHLFWMEDVCAQRAEPEQWWRHRAFPRVLAIVLHALVKLAHALRPAWSYHLNAELEDAAERGYLRFVLERPELENEPAPCDEFESLADLIRQMALDERQHRDESLALCAALRSARR